MNPIIKSKPRLIVTHLTKRDNRLCSSKWIIGWDGVDWINMAQDSDQ
jgi:hypothetical protein